MKWDDTPEGKEYRKKYHAEYYLKNREKFAVHNRKYCSDPEVRKRKNMLDRQRASKAKEIIYNVLGGAICKHCGHTDIRVLQLDHINGGGSRDRRANRSSTKILRMYRDDLNKLKKVYQILCANCNWIKKHENNEVACR